MNNHTTFGYGYTFTHKSTKRKVIAQSWSEYFKLSDDNEYDNTYKLLGISKYSAINIFYNTGSTREYEEKLNRFWSGAKGYEKIGKIDCVGITCNPIRMFLKNLHNHACMIGDKQLLTKINQSSLYFYAYSSIDYNNPKPNISQLLLN